MVETQTRQNTFWLWSNAIDFQKRGDVAYWFPANLSTTIAQLPYKLSDVAKLSDLRFSPNQNPNDKFFYIDISNINTSDGSYAKTEMKNVYAPSRARKKLERFDVIVSTVRPNRNATSLILEEADALICSTGFAVLKAIKINPYYLLVFTKTSYFIDQLVRQTSATMYPAVNENDVLNVRLFIPSEIDQQKIEQVVRDAFSLKKEAESHYQRSWQLLNEALGLPVINQEREMTFWFWSDEINFTEKLHPAVYEIPKIIKVKNFIKIGDYAESLSYGTSEDLTYQNEGIPFLRITDIDECFQIDGANIKHISQFDAEKLTKYRAPLNNVLISRTGTLGSAILIDKNLEGSIFGSYFIKVRFGLKIKEKVNLEYLTFFINSEVGKAQTASLGSGGVQTNLTISAIENIKIPLINKSTQDEIVKQLQLFKTKRQLSKQKLQEAKEFVENLVKNP